MDPREHHLDREVLLGYFESAATPRDGWQVGMELEQMGRRTADGRPIPYDGDGPTVRRTLELILDRRKGNPILEGDHLIGIDAPWGSISLEPGGQVEWSSRPFTDLDEMARALRDHREIMTVAAEELGVRWLDVAVDPEHPVSAMEWMPKARYKIMAPYLGSRGDLAHRMMTQTASIQCAYDYLDSADWKNKFKAAALLAPMATALFANSSRLDGSDSGFASYRQRIWRETDPDRCGLPPVVFEPGFDLGRWLDYVLDTPAIFVHRSRGLAPAGGVPFRRLLELAGCDAVKLRDWETHISTIFTDVRSYSYLEIRSADLLPGERALAVPAFWTGLLYHDDSLAAALELGAALDDHGVWSESMAAAAKHGLDATVAGRPLRELTRSAVELSLAGLQGGATCAGSRGTAAAALETLAADHGIAGGA